MGQRINTNFLKTTTKREAIIAEWYSKNNVAEILFEDLYFRKILSNYAANYKLKTGSIFIKRTLLNEIYILYNNFQIKIPQKPIKNYKTKITHKFKNIKKKHSFTKFHLLKRTFCLLLNTKYNKQYPYNYLKKNNIYYKQYCFFLKLQKYPYQNIIIKKHACNFKNINKKLLQVFYIPTLKNQILKKTFYYLFFYLFFKNTPQQRKSKIFNKKIQLCLQKKTKKRQAYAKKIQINYKKKKTNFLIKKLVLTTINPQTILIPIKATLPNILSKRKNYHTINFNFYNPRFLKKFRFFEYFLKRTEILQDPIILQNKLKIIFTKNYRKIINIFRQFKFLFAQLAEMSYKIKHFFSLMEGIKLQYRGKLRKASRATLQKYHAGSLQTQTFDKNIKYTYTQIKHKFGTNGAHLWIQYHHKHKLFYFYYKKIITNKIKFFTFQKLRNITQTNYILYQRTLLNLIKQKKNKLLLQDRKKILYFNLFNFFKQNLIKKKIKIKNLLKK